MGHLYPDDPHGDSDPVDVVACWREQAKCAEEEEGSPAAVSTAATGLADPRRPAVSDLTECSMCLRGSAIDPCAECAAELARINSMSAADRRADEMAMARYASEGEEGGLA